jgi:hypothetical protein
MVWTHTPCNRWFNTAIICPQVTHSMHRLRRMLPLCTGDTTSLVAVSLMNESLGPSMVTLAHLATSARKQAFGIGCDSQLAHRSCLDRSPIWTLEPAGQCSCVLSTIRTSTVSIIVATVNLLYDSPVLTSSKASSTTKHLHADAGDSKHKSSAQSNGQTIAAIASEQSFSSEGFHPLRSRQKALHSFSLTSIFFDRFSRLSGSIPFPSALSRPQSWHPVTPPSRR